MLKKNLRHSFSFIEWSLNPFLFVSFRIYLDSSWLLRQLKTVFPCSRILYPCPESLGLDITSAIFNHFKNGSNMPLFLSFFYLWFLSIKESYEQLIPAWYAFDRKSFTDSNNFSFWFENCLNRSLSISISKIYLRSCSNLLISNN